MRKFCVSLSGYKLEQHHERERLLKRRGRDIMKHGNLDNILQDGSDTVHTVLQSVDFFHNVAFIEGT